jgi:hypothetical protein
MAAQGPSTNQSAPEIAARTTIKVKAAPGVRVPMQGAARRYIDDSAEVSVTRTAYYIRRIKDGDLVQTDLPAAAKAAPAPATTTPQARGVASEA